MKYPFTICMVVLFLLFSRASAATQPPDGISPNGKFYYFHEQLSQSAAGKSCREHGGMLATILSRKDQQDLTDLVSHNTFICGWVGGHIIDTTSRTFAWENGHKISRGNYPGTTCLQSYCGWMKGFPFTNIRNAIVLTRSGWDNDRAESAFPYFCQVCPFQNAALRTLRDGGDSFRNFSITTEGTDVKITMQPEYGAAFVVGPPVEQLENSHEPYGQQLVQALWPGKSESNVVSLFRQPADNLRYDINANCLLTMTASIERFCGPREDISNLPTHYARQCSVTLCKLYAANEQKTQLRVAMCSAVEFELRYAKDNAHCDSQSSGLVGCAPSVHVFDWSTNKAGNTYEFRGMESVRDANITKVECESKLMDCSTCFVTHGSTFRCLAKNTTTSSSGSTQSERVTMKITANGVGPHGTCPHAPGSGSTCTSVMTHTAQLTQVARALTVHNFQTFAASFGCAPGQVLPLSRSDRLSFEILAINEGLLSITKLMLVGKTQSFNILAKKTMYDLQSTVNKTLLFGDGSGAASAGVKVKVGESVKIDFGLATLGDVTIEESLKVVVEVERRPLVITNRRRQELLAAAPRRHEATLGEICLGEHCEENFNKRVVAHAPPAEDSMDDANGDIVTGVGVAAGVLFVGLVVAVGLLAHNKWNKDLNGVTAVGGEGADDPAPVFPVGAADVPQPSPHAAAPVAKKKKETKESQGTTLPCVVPHH